MPEWIRYDAERSLSKPGAVSFRYPTDDATRRFDYYRRDLFLREAGDILWHLGSERQHEPLIIGCDSNPLALAVQPTVDSPPILDLFTVDRDRVLWHRRFSPPPEGSFAREGRLGCLTAVLDRILGTRRLDSFFPNVGWTSLGGPWNSNPAGISLSSGLIYVAARRGEEFFLRRFSREGTGSPHWDRNWRPMLGAGWVSDPVMARWGLGETAIFAVHLDGGIYMYTVSGSSWNTEPLGSPLGNETPLGGDFAQLPPAVLTDFNGKTVFALAQNRQLKYRRFDIDDNWRTFGDETRRWSTAPVTLFWQRMGEDYGGRSFVFIRDDSADQHLWFSFIEAGNNSWHEWEDLGGSETSEFSVIPESLHLIAIYARGRGSDPHLWRAHLELS